MSRMHAAWAGSMPSTKPAAPAGSGTARYPNGAVVPTNPPSSARRWWPSGQRSRRRSRSNSANTPSSCSIIRPAGVLVSMPSPADSTRTPSASSRSINSSRCSRLRPNRSSLATRMTSISPAVAAATSSCNAGRDDAAPDTPASTYSPASAKPCRRARLRHWSRWVSIEVASTWPPVETRRYAAAGGLPRAKPAAPAGEPERGPAPTAGIIKPPARPDNDLDGAGWMPAPVEPGSAAAIRPPPLPSSYTSAVVPVGAGTCPLAAAGGGVAECGHRFARRRAIRMYCDPYVWSLAAVGLLMRSESMRADRGRGGFDVLEEVRSASAAPQYGPVAQAVVGVRVVGGDCPVPVRPRCSGLPLWSTSALPACAPVQPRL
jgi:hypothetical protein